METLAVEFNREVSEIELAIKTFMDLEMVEVTQDKIYKVKNFTKHQNIKTSKKDQNQNNAKEAENNKENEKITGNQIVKDLDKNIGESTDKILQSSDSKSEPIVTEKNEKEKLYEGCDNKINENKVIDINTTDTKNTATQNLSTEKLKNEGDSPGDILAPLSNKKVKNKSKPRKKEIINEISV
ncbi:MAG: N-terminal phage replisome organiser, partial [Clostridium sp. Maddingley MBC34-26]